MGNWFASEPQPQPATNIYYRPETTYYRSSGSVSRESQNNYSTREPSRPETYYRSSGSVSRESQNIFSTRQPSRPETYYRSSNDAANYGGWTNSLVSRQSRNADDIRRLNTQIDEIASSLWNQEIGRNIPRPEKSRRNPGLFNIYASEIIVTYIELEPDDWEYRTVAAMITNKKNFRVDSIDKIENPYLEKAYELKKAQKKISNGVVEERLLFHGTKRANLDSICTMNFDYRRCLTHKYGKGISFSPNSTYASNYSDDDLNNRVMIVAQVLIGRSCLGNQSMELPPPGFDTTQKGDDGIVIVKFEDNEFLPVYVINYHLKHNNPPRKYGNKKRGANRSPHSSDLNSSYDYDRDYDYDY